LTLTAFGIASGYYLRTPEYRSISKQRSIINFYDFLNTKDTILISGRIINHHGFADLSIDAASKI
jgi:hypothetical protein